MNDRRVVITGTGIISCVGNSVQEFWDSLVNCRSGIGPVTRFDVSKYRTRIAGEVKNFSIDKYMSSKEARRLDMFCHYAIAAADEAIKSAGISPNLEGLDPTRVGVLTSSGIGGMQTFEQQCNILYNRGPDKSSPLLIPMLIGDMASGSISMRYGAKGPNFGIVSACASACHSIGESLWIIKRGDADIMITGGAEATVSPIGFAGFCSMRAMSERNDDPLRASRPFDAQRDGFVMSEGSGVVILEELEHARKRGANIIAELIGYGTTADAYHITSPAPDGAGAAQAIRMALGHAKLRPDEIDYINAHGTSTPLNDKFETAAIKSVFGQHAHKLNISSTKGMTGHALGAAGGLETIVCALSIKNGIIPPTLNYENPDPDCDLNYTPNKPIERKINTAVNINLGFGGHNAVLVLRSFTS
ncbi:MAG TPA: beta-ketoacyl-[acyl-carrier-protein] synthase II [Lentisphaeria bacterium]|nr:MAG: beta-ketoacyl-[acyl-carrier-protein] synthase II [Lentisphaerae bacterium GWF2_49_21]HBC89083.1 beta-ketoacyl-[acyl-carrier-protein] synthase II [Lentisphaeria bacterium]